MTTRAALLPVPGFGGWMRRGRQLSPFPYFHKTDEKWDKILRMKVPSSIFQDNTLWEKYEAVHSLGVHYAEGSHNLSALNNVTKVFICWSCNLALKVQIEDSPCLLSVAVIKTMTKRKQGRKEFIPF